jgi:serine/threonine protein kinase
MRELRISPDTSAEDQEAVRKRWNEGIERLRNLNHPSIPPLVFSFQAYGNYYLVMEYVSKRPLEALLSENKGPLGEEQVIQWMMQVCDVISYLHSCSPPIILERLMPDDIGITPENSICLAGIDTTLRLVYYSPPPKRNIMGKLPSLTFFSPEALGAKFSHRGMLIQTDARSDIYSLGANIYYLLTNYQPNPAWTPEPGSISAKNPRLHTVQVGNQTVCPIEQVIIKAMQQDPAMRFQNVNAMRTALKYCLTTI